MISESSTVAELASHYWNFSGPAPCRQYAKPCRSPFVVYSTKLAILCPILIFFIFYIWSKGENVSTQFCDSLKPGWIHCREKQHFYPFLLCEEQAEEWCSSPSPFLPLNLARINTDSIFSTKSLAKAAFSSKCTVVARKDVAHPLLWRWT